MISIFLTYDMIQLKLFNDNKMTILGIGSFE